jgi:hypothetical protein
MGEETQSSVNTCAGILLSCCPRRILFSGHWAPHVKPATMDIISLIKTGDYLVLCIGRSTRNTTSLFCTKKQNKNKTNFFVTIFHQPLIQYALICAVTLDLVGHTHVYSVYSCTVTGNAWINLTTLLVYTGKHITFCHLHAGLLA